MYSLLPPELDLGRCGSFGTTDGACVKQVHGVLKFDFRYYGTYRMNMPISMEVPIDCSEAEWSGIMVSEIQKLFETGNNPSAEPDFYLDNSPAIACRVDGSDAPYTFFEKVVDFAVAWLYRGVYVRCHYVSLNPYWPLAWADKS
jgi:hypothetical protein